MTLTLPTFLLLIAGKRKSCLWNLTCVALCVDIYSWFSATDTLAKLHSIDPESIGLGSFGKSTNFYARHCNTFSRIEAQQSAVTDKKTGRQLGRAHEKYDQLIDFVRGNLPKDRSCIVHGDFKFDNLVSTLLNRETSKDWAAG